MTGNKGDWSEFYAFIKLLADGRLDFGGPNFTKLEGKYYPIISISRAENGKIRVYEIDGTNIKIILDSNEVTVINGSNLKNKVVDIFKRILEAEKTFEIPEADELMKQLHSESLKANSQTKEDLIIKIHDLITNTQPEIGFSIKSMIGNPATLLNASSATNFVYEIKGLPTSCIDDINKIDTSSKIRDRLTAIKDAGGSLEYFGMDSSIFEENLRLCDTIMPEILAQMLLYYNYGTGSTLEALIKQMITDQIKVRGFSIELTAYEYKLQNLLYAIALGMVPGSKWDGLTRAYGGYIIVREDGELVGYNVYNADIFRKYLLMTTKFETASSTRHEFGNVYSEKGKKFIKLNLQIRFIK